VKIFGFVQNKKQEGLVANIILRAYDIPNTNVMLHLNGEDIALMASTNHPPKCGLCTFRLLNGHNVIALLQNKE
jgi:hypothetical protein